MPRLNYRRGLNRAFVLVTIAWLFVAAFLIVDDYMASLRSAREEASDAVTQRYGPAVSSSQVAEEIMKVSVPFFTPGRLLMFPIVAMLPPALLYGTGLVLAWVVRGFRKD